MTRTRAIVGEIRHGAEPWPIIVDGADGTVVRGRHRIVAFHMLGLGNVPVVRLGKAMRETTPTCHPSRSQALVPSPRGPS